MSTVFAVILTGKLTGGLLRGLREVKRSETALSKAFDDSGCLARAPHTHFQASRKMPHRVLAVKQSETEGVRHSAENGRN